MTASETKALVPEPKKTGRPDIVRQFFERVLTDAEQRMMPLAREMDGLDEEIALLRTKLRTLARKRRRNKKDGKRDTDDAKARTEDFQLLTKGMETLAKLLSVRYRLNQQSREDLAASVASVLQAFRSELGLGEDNVP